jgi:hypothetical protein
MERLDPCRHDRCGIHFCPRPSRHGAWQVHPALLSVAATAMCTPAHSNTRDRGCSIVYLSLTNCTNILTLWAEPACYARLRLTNVLPDAQSMRATLRGERMRHCNRAYGIGQACVAAALAVLLQAGSGIAPAAAIEAATPANRPFWEIDELRVGVLDHALEDAPT